MIPPRSPTASCHKSSSPWRTTQPSLTARVRTKARSIASLSSTPLTSRSEWPRHTFNNWKKRTPSAQDRHSRRPLTGFYPAEQYHQNYLALHPDQPYIVYNDLPKLEHLTQQFPQLYQSR